MNKRIEYFDILRGLAIVGVVIIHSSSLGLGFPDESINFNFTILWRQLWNFSVPLFLTLSGYFLTKKHISSKKEYTIFLRKQIPRVYLPMLFWSILWLVISIFVLNESILKEIILLIIFQSSGPYYFIALIIQYYILLPHLQKISNLNGLIISLFISLLMAVIIFYIRYFTDIKLFTIIYAGNFLTWIVFFIFGLYLGSSKKILVSNKFLLTMIMFFYILSCVESYLLYLHFHQIGDAVTAVKVSSFLYSLALIAYLFKNIDTIKHKIIRKIGEISFGIYLIHMFVIMIASKTILNYIPYIQEFQPIYQFILAVLTITFSYFLIFIGNNILSNKWIRYLGFK